MADNLKKQDFKEKQDQKKSTPLTVIGGGHVLTRYLLPISNYKNGFHICRVIGRRSYEAFLKHLHSNPNASKYKHVDLEKITYQQTTGTTIDIVNKINEISLRNEAILILTPPQIHLKILKKILEHTDKKIYLEKPAVINLKDFKTLIKLAYKHTDRIYFSEQYVYGRAPILLKAYHKYKKQLGDISSIKLFLEEGSKYFDEIQNWVSIQKHKGHKYFDLTKSWFADVGPELDLGVHVLGILFRLLGNGLSYKITDVGQLKNYPKNYSVAANLLFYKEGMPKFKVLLGLGKSKGKNKRFFKINCKNGELLQKFTTETCEDPVFVSLNGKKKEYARYPKNYHYFKTQMFEFLSWLKKPYSQNYVFQALECALKIKERRLKEHKKNMKENKIKFAAMIPALMTTKRIKKKNIRDMSGKPMVYYAVKAAIDAKIFDEIYVNSESDLIGTIGKKLGVNYYKRGQKLAEEHVSNEDFVFDFLQNVKAEYLFMINPNKPLITPKEISKFVKKMILGKFDTMFSVEELNTQVFFKKKAINFNVNKPHIRSYEIEPVQAIQWTITGWRTKTFLENYTRKGYAVYSGRIGLFNLSRDATLSVDYEKDFILAEQLLNIRFNNSKNK